MENQKHAGLLTHHMLDLNPNKNLFFSLNIDGAMSLAKFCKLLQHTG